MRKSFRHICMIGIKIDWYTLKKEGLKRVDLKSKCKGLTGERELGSSGDIYGPGTPLCPWNPFGKPKG